MKPEKLNKFIAQMKIELAEAESKHPHFADGLSERSAGNVKFNLKAMRDINGKPTYGQSYQNPKKFLNVWDAKSAPHAGLCSEERSMISPDYARNFICDFILGKKQDIGQLTLF